MLHHVPFSRRWPLRLAGLTGCALAATGSVAPAPAGAATVGAFAQPLGIVNSSAGRPTCSSLVAPFQPSDLSSVLTGFMPLGEAGPPEATLELSAAAYASEFVPSVRLCSPTFAGIPGPITGAIASAPRRSRVGAGWRELGGSLSAPAVLSPGDALALPEVDDAGVATLSVAQQPGRPAATIALTDLAPGPSRIAISEDARGLVATLTRADGTTAEGIAKPTVVAPITTKVSGSPRRWRIAVTARPGTAFVLRGEYLGDYGSSDQTATAIVGPTGQTTTVLKLDQKVRRRSSGYLTGVAVDRAAQVASTFSCGVRVNRKSKPTSIRCTPERTPYAISEFDSPFPFHGPSPYYDGVRRFSDAATATLRDLENAVETLLGDTAARSATAATPTSKAEPLARRNAIIGRSSAPATAPLVARPAPQAPQLVGAALQEVRALASDLNGDGALDFWTDRPLATTAWWPSNGGTAGSVLISGPTGLVPHRIDIPSMRGNDSASDSELSAIADITGDGLGELVVDIDERHAVIPGSRTWTGTTFPLRAGDASSLQPDEIVLAPSISSPGSPYSTLDDADGDGQRELAATDDMGGWASFAPSVIERGTITHLPAVARVGPVAPAIQRTYQFDPAVPRVDPRLRIIAGQAVSVRWPVVASRSVPKGAVEVAVSDARGAPVRPVITVPSTGNALLLDYDRPSGDILLLSVGPRCLNRRDYRRNRCRETLLRVRGDGTIRSSTTVNPYRSIQYLGAARFISDGPDADSLVDVVFTVGNRGIGAIESGQTGVLTTKSLPTAILDATESRPFYEELKLIPVVEANGARKLTTSLPRDSQGDEYAYQTATGVPAEIVWK